MKYRAVEGYGAQVTLCEPTVTSRNETAARVQAETGAYLVHPYDDDRIIAGQATAAKELLEEVADLDAVFAPVSGGGLLSGTCLGAKGVRSDVRVFGCEPERADDAYRSITSGTLQSQDSSDTIADGLRAALAPRTFAILRTNVDGILLTSEEEIIGATRLVWERMKIIVEPSSAVAIAPLLRPGAIAAFASAAARGWRDPENRDYIFRRQCGSFRPAVLIPVCETCVRTASVSTCLRPCSHPEMRAGPAQRPVTVSTVRNKA